MEQKTYEIIIETLVAELQMERWRLKEARQQLEVVRKDNASLVLELKKIKKENENG